MIGSCLPRTSEVWRSLDHIQGRSQPLPKSRSDDTFQGSRLSVDGRVLIYLALSSPGLWQPDDLNISTLCSGSDALV